MFQSALISGNGGGGTPKCIWKASGLLKSDGTVINPIETKIIGVNSGTTNYNVGHDGIMLADIRTSDQSITYKGVTVQANPSNITPVSFFVKTADSISVRNNSTSFGAALYVYDINDIEF